MIHLHISVTLLRNTVLQKKKNLHSIMSKENLIVLLCSPCRCFPSGSHYSLGPQLSSHATRCSCSPPTSQVSVYSSVDSIIYSITFPNTKNYNILYRKLITVILHYIKMDIWSHIMVSLSLRV